MASKVVFLDRDGTINIDHGYVYRIEDWELFPGVIEALQKLQAAGFQLAIITNQSGIAAGFYKEEDMQRLHEHMVKQLLEAGIQLAAIAHCPHGRDSTCDCRKPRTGMAKQIEAKIGPIDYTASWTIGDKIADLEFGVTLGTHTALIRSEYWQEPQLTKRPEQIVDSLKDAAQYITNL